MIKRLKLFFATLKQLRAAVRGEGSDADIERHTKAIMAAAGLPDEENNEPGPGTELSDEAVELLLDPPYEMTNPDDFSLNEAHIALIRQARLNWNGTEVGAPELDVVRPYVKGSTLDLLTELLGQDANDLDKARFLIRHPLAVQTFLEEAELAQGRYVLKNIDWTQVERAGAGLQGFEDLFAINRDMSIDVTGDDIALARAATWEWPDEFEMESALEQNEVAGPTVDPKRPYGDMSFYQLDIHRALGWPTERKNEDGYIELTDEQEEEGTRLHFRQIGVVQAMLENARHPAEAA